MKTVDEIKIEVASGILLFVLATTVVGVCTLGTGVYVVSHVARATKAVLDPIVAFLDEASV